MSDIDSYQHEYLGVFMDIPVYHVTTPSPGCENERQKSDANWGGFLVATPTNLVIGGGTGEHSAIVLHDLDCFVAAFLINEIDRGRYEISKEDFKHLRELTRPRADEILEYCEWDDEDHADFVERAVSHNLILNEREADGLEIELINAMGGFIYFCMPELCSGIERFRKIAGPHEVFPPNVTVMCEAPGYPLIRGRQTGENGVSVPHHRWG